MEAIVSRVLDTPGGRVHARVGGRGPRIVFVHGLGVASPYMVPTMERLPDFECWAPDLPGFGHSGPAQRGRTVEGMAADLADVLVELEPPAVVLANSAGCQYAVACATARPGLISRLVLVGPTIDPVARSGTRQLLRWLANSVGESPRQLPVLVGDYRRTNWKVVREAFRSLLEDRLEDRLPDVEQPALVVRGEQDRIVPQAWAEEIVRLLRRGRLELVPGAAHTVNFTHPEELAAAMRHFVSRDGI